MRQCREHIEISVLPLLLIWAAEAELGESASVHSEREETSEIRAKWEWHKK